MAVIGAVMASSWLPLAAPQVALAAPGDFVQEVNFSQNCASGIGVGVAYDGAGHLWLSCYASNPDLLRASATTGVVDQTYNIAGDLGALAYDSTRNALWDAEAGNIYFIQLDASKSVVSHKTAFSPGVDAEGLVDGLAYDATNDSLYFKPDVSNPIHHYTVAGAKIGDINGANSCIGMAGSGLAIGGNDLYEGKNGCSHVYVVDKTTQAPVFDFSTVIASDPNHRDEGLSCDIDTFKAQNKQVMWSKEAYSPNRAAAFEIPPGTCGNGGAPPPACSPVNGDTQAPTIGFTRTSVGGVPSVQVDVVDPGPVDGLQLVQASGTNLNAVSSGTSASSQTPISPVQALGGTLASIKGLVPGASATFTFVASKIDPNAAATITVRAVDCSGNVFDPPFVLHGKGLHGQKDADRRSIHVVFDKD